MISLGQYKTPLYYRKSDSYSSKTGGVISLVSFALLFGLAIMYLKEAFSGSDANLKMEQQNFFYNIYQSGLWKTDDSCDKKPCTKLTVDDFIVAYSNQNPFICITYPENDSTTNLSNPCENFTLYHKFFDIIVNKSDIDTTIYE